MEASGIGMSSVSVGWLAVATGVAGLFGLASIVMFFTVGQPFGTLNDLLIGLTALLSAALAISLSHSNGSQSLQFSRLLTAAAVLGAGVVVSGTVIVVSGYRGWFFAGLMMAAGNALIGVWVVGLNYSALNAGAWPNNLAIFGMVVGAVMMLGLAAVPGIPGGIDAWDAAPWYVAYVGQAGALGYLGLFPIWSVLLGRAILLN